MPVCVFRKLLPATSCKKESKDMVTRKGFYYKMSKGIHCLMEMKGVIANLIWSCLKLQQPECPEW